jgi:hypothetical protein
VFVCSFTCLSRVKAPRPNFQAADQKIGDSRWSKFWVFLVFSGVLVHTN